MSKERNCFEDIGVDERIILHYWNGILIGVHCNSEGVLHTTSRAVTLAGFSVDNHGQN